MTLYRCYFLDTEDRIRGAADIEAEALEEAIESALLMLRFRPQHHAVELWEGARKVYPVNPAGRH